MVNTVVKKVYVLDGGELELDASVMVSGDGEFYRSSQHFYFFIMP